MIYLYTLLLSLLILLLFRYPAHLLIFTILLTLAKFLKLIHIDMILLINILPGISINFTDFFALIMIPIIAVSIKKHYVSKELILLIFFLFASVFFVLIFSFLALDTSLSLIGNRLRQYFIYLFIPGLICLIGGKKRFQFFLFSVFSIAILACLIQFAEFARGDLFIIRGKAVDPSLLHEGMIRVVNRAHLYTLFIFSTSLAMLASKFKRKSLFILPLILSVTSLLLSFTRTAYIFMIVSGTTIYLMLLFGGKGKFISTIMSILVVVALLGGLLTFTGNSNVSDSIIKRFLSIGPSFTDKSRISTMNARMKQIKYIVETAKEANFPPILGLGISNKSVKLRTADVGFINILVNLGIFGLIFSFWWFSYLYRNAVRLNRLTKNNFHSSLSLGIVGCVAAMIPTLINYDFFTGLHFPLLVLVTVTVETLSIIERESQTADEELNNDKHITLAHNLI